VVLQHLREELGLGGGLPTGSPLGRLAATREMEDKIYRFLAETLEKRAAFGWEIAVDLQGKPVSLHFAGAALEGGILVVAARSRNGVARVNEELMRINNEQANSLREAAKSLAMAARESPGGEEDLLDEFSRVNNELATLQRDLARKNAQLARLNEQKNRLLGMAAHDLRSPLGVIQSYSEFLRDEAAEALDEEQREFVDAIRDASRFMLSIIDDLLDVAQIEAGTLRLEREETDLAELVRQNVVLNRVLAARKDIRLELAAPGEPVHAHIDPRKIQQVLYNLLSNAIKYSHGGTTVTVALEADTDTARITVRDEGEGIAEADIPRLFQPFSKASRRGTSGEPSTGLGLAIVRRIVEGHGGRVGLESSPGKGSTFTVHLPRCAEP
jgi:two-component system, OmpR family, sensor kinase